MDNRSIDQYSWYIWGKVLNNLRYGCAEKSAKSAKAGIKQKELEHYTYTESEVPMTTSASTLSRSASRDRRTLSLRVSPKKVTAGLKTPPQTSSDVRCRFLVLWIGSRGDGLLLFRRGLISV